MKQHNAIRLALLALALTAACASQAPSQVAAPDTQATNASSADPEADKTAIGKVMEAMNAGWNAHDMDAFGAVFRDSATFINVFGHLLDTRPTIVFHHKKIHERQFRETQIFTTKLDVRLLSEHVAVAMVYWRLEGARDPRTDEPVQPTNGVMTTTLTKEADGWKIVALQNTQTVPLPGPPADAAGGSGSQR